MTLDYLESLLPYCLENKRRRREFLRGVKQLPKSGPNWRLFNGYRLALSGRTEEARQCFMQGYFECEEPQLRARFHWAVLSLERSYPHPTDLDELCQWLSGALHDGPAQSLALHGPRQPARELAELASWLRNPLLEGQSLEEALQDCLAPLRAQELVLEQAPPRLERLFFRVFQEVAESRQALSPRRIRLSVRKRGKFWLADWEDEIGHSPPLPTARARAAQLDGRILIRLDPGFQLQLRCPRRGRLSYRQGTPVPG